MDAHPVRDVDRLLRVIHADVHVQAEQQLLAGDEAQRVDDLEVARPLDDPLVLPLRERVGAGGADRQAPRLGRLADPAAQVLELARRLARVAADVRGDLEHGLHQLGLDPPSVSPGTASIISSIAETRSIDSPSTIISSSSTPSV